ncbi:MAG: hypothetical protein ACRDUA_20115, partial [Micromonosporaceae bacterium]
PVDLARAGRWVSRSPMTGLVVVIGLIYLNQVLVTVYVVREHNGDPSFIAQRVPDGWFSLAHRSVLELLARHFPVPELLAPSVLRVNAFLELPFVLLSYLVVCGWFSPWTYERAVALVWPMSVSYTATFCMIEWHLYNQYTSQDIAVRIVAAVVVPWWITRLCPARSRRPTESVPGLLVFLASALGLGVMVLVVYDTALLYNLGHVDTQLPFAALAIVVLATARTIAPRVSTHPSGPGMRSIACTTAWLLVLTAVPALPIRYGLGFGAPYVAVAGAVVLFTVAAVRGARATFARTPGRPGRWLVHMTAVAIAGVCAAAAVDMVVHTEYIEARLLIAGSTGVLVALLVCAGLDWRAKDTEVDPPARTSDQVP